MSRRVPLVLSDPRAYPREAMLLAAIIGLAFITAALLISVLVEAIKSGRRRRSLGTRRRESTVLTTALLVVAVCLSVLVLAGLAPLAPQSARACAQCHRMGSAVSSWEAGVHSEVACYGCHARPGVSGALEASVRGAGRLVGGSPDAAGSSVVYAGCLGCHSELARSTVGSEVRVRHKELIDSGIDCVTCHPSVGHDGLAATASAPDLGRDVMSWCLPCHDGVRAPSECRLCHVSGPLDARGLTYDQNAAIEVTCKGCHANRTTERCVGCHGLELPHPATFRKQHAALSWGSPALCARCHPAAQKDRACACHDSDANVHGTYEQWFPRHGGQARASGPGGCLCHSEAAFASCGRCHDSDPWGK